MWKRERNHRHTGKFKIEKNLMENDKTFSLRSRHVHELHTYLCLYIYLFTHISINLFPLFHFISLLSPFPPHSIQNLQFPSLFSTILFPYDLPIFTPPLHELIVHFFNNPMLWFGIASDPLSLCGLGLQLASCTQNKQTNLSFLGLFNWECISILPVLPSGCYIHTRIHAYIHAYMHTHFQAQTER